MNNYRNLRLGKWQGKKQKLSFPIMVLMFVVLLQWPLFGNTPPREGMEEKVFVHLSDAMLLTGETLWMNISVKIDGNPSPSKVVYAELLDREGNPVKQQIIGLNEGYAAGYLEIPERIKSDHYLLRIYTRNSPFAKNQNKVFHHWVTVINPEIPPKIQAKKDEKALPYTNENHPNLIGLENLKFQNQELIKLPLKGDFSGPVHVSVTYYYKDFHPGTVLNFEDLYTSQPEEDLIPELYGHIIKGRYLADEVDTLETFYLSAHGTQSHLFLGKPNQEGDFYFETSSFSHFDFVVVQSSKTQEQVNFLLDSPFWKARPQENFSFPELVLGAELKEFLDNRLLAKATNGYYFTPMDLPPSQVPFQFIADHSYLLDDYNRFDDMATVIREYVPHVLVRSQGKKTIFKNYNIPYESVFQENPLTLIDGMPVFQSDEFANFNPQGIRKMDIINRYVYIQNEIYNGVISLTSFENDFGKFDLPKNALFIEYEGLQVPKTPVTQIKKSAKEMHTPDFRNILYWNTIVTESEIGENSIQFEPSLIKGKYRVMISYWDQVAKNWKEEHQVIQIE